MGKTSSDVAIVRLRRRAREAGISIRMRRASKSRPERAYDLIEKASGRRLYGPVALEDIEPTLARIAEDRGHLAPVEAERFCEWCGSEQPGLTGGNLERTSDGLRVCSECARSMAWSQPTERPTRRRPLVGPAPLRDNRSDFSVSVGTRRWMSLSAAVLGLATLIIAMQQPALQDPDRDGGVLDALATPRSDPGRTPASSGGELSFAPASSSPLASGPVASPPPPRSSGSPAAPAVSPTVPRPRAGTQAGPAPTPAPAAATSRPTARATKPPAAASPSPRPTAVPTPPPPSPEPTDVAPSPVVTPSPEPEASDAPASPPVAPSTLR